MAILGSNVPSTTNGITLRSRGLSFARFTPVQDILIDSLYCYCRGGSDTDIRYCTNITMYITDNVWNYDTDFYATICAYTIHNTSIYQQGWAWRGGLVRIPDLNQIAPVTLKAGVTYNFGLYAGATYSEGSSSYVGSLTNGPTNSFGSSYVSTWGNPFPAPTYNQSLLPSLYGSGDLVITGPPVTIGGKTPGKLEHTSWANIASLK